MADNKANTQNSSSGGKVIVALIALVLIAVGAIAYLSGQIGGEKDATSSAAQVAANDNEEAAVDTAATETAAGAETQEAAAEAQPAEQQADAEPITIEPGNPVVAKVNGEDVTRIDVFAYIQNLGPQVQQMPIEQLFPMAVNQVVNAKIVNEKIAKTNLDNDPAVKQQLEAAKEQIVRNVFIQKEVEKAMTDERLKQAYDQYTANFPEIEEVKTRHILVQDEELAKDLLKQIKDGADFAALAKEHSIDATKDKGGELNYIAKTDQVLPEFADAALALDVGEVSKKPLETQFGYHIIETLDKRTRKPAEFEQAKPFLAAQIRNDVLNELVEGWREAADIEVLNINGQPIEPAAGDEAPAEVAQ